MNVLNETIKMANGRSIPKLGLGTWFIADDQAADAVKEAVKIGYRLIDTAQAYGNEAGVGLGVRECGLPREELFVTSKVAAEHKDYQSAKKSIDETLSKMGLDYLDLMLIHSPQPWDKVNQSSYRYEKENAEVWRAMEDALKEGKLKAIGVSNFLQSDLDALSKNAQIQPMVNQVLCHITNTPQALIDYCKDHDIVVEAYSPVAHGEALKNPAIAKMAEQYGVTIPQLCIAYDLQLGLVTLPKTANPAHMKTNADINFTISDADMEILKNLPHIQNYGEFGMFPVYGGKIKD